MSRSAVKIPDRDNLDENKGENIKAEFYKTPSVERLVTGGTYVLVFGLLTAIFGWLFTAIASRSDIGIGADALGFLITATAFQVIALCISGGFHQALSKYISEALVESKEKALRYARAAFVVFNIIGIILFAIFFSIAILMIPSNLGYGLLFGIMAFIFYLTFFRDNFLGNLAGIHRFDYIGKINFVSGVIGISIGFLILYLIPFSLNASLLPLIIVINLIVAIGFLFHYGQKTLPYPLTSIFRGARRREMSEVLRYGLYCTVPNIIFSATIMWIQNLWYSGFFGFDKLLVTANGLIIGYAGVVFAINNFGWPQIPAVSEAKARNDYKLIDNYMKNTLHTGFNLTAFFLVIYIGLSHLLLSFIHGPEYLVAHIPFIILIGAVAILGVEFLICTLLMGLGEGKKAAYLILFITFVQIILVPILITLLKSIYGSVAPQTLYAGPVSLLIASIMIFPFAFKYLKNFTTNPPQIYSRILKKAVASIFCTLIIYIILDLMVFPNNDPLIGFFVRTAILFGLFQIFMLLFAGYHDKDLDIYEGIKFFSPIARCMRWILHHSPYYEQQSDNKDTESVRSRDENGI